MASELDDVMFRTRIIRTIFFMQSIAEKDESIVVFFPQLPRQGLPDVQGFLKNLSPMQEAILVGFMSALISYEADCFSDLHRRQCKLEGA